MGRVPWEPESAWTTQPQPLWGSLCRCLWPQQTAPQGARWVLISPPPSRHFPPASGSCGKSPKLLTLEELSFKSIHSFTLHWTSSVSDPARGTLQQPQQPISWGSWPSGVENPHPQTVTPGVGWAGLGGELRELWEPQGGTRDQPEQAREDFLEEGVLELRSRRREGVRWG